MKLLILTGMSGAGKHTAFKIFEDFGYYCVDNLPVQLLSDFVKLAWKTRRKILWWQWVSIYVPVSPCLF